MYLTIKRKVAEKQKTVKDHLSKLVSKRQYDPQARFGVLPPAPGMHVPPATPRTLGITVSSSPLGAEKGVPGPGPPLLSRTAEQDSDVALTPK